MKKYPNLLLSAILLVFLFISCAEEKPENKNQTVNNVDKRLLKFPATAELYFFLPSPIQIAHILNKSGLKYVSGLTNNPTKYDQYQTRTSGLLNLGVYTGDLAYCALNDRIDESLTYMEVVKKMGGKLDLSEIYQSQEIMNDLQNAVGNKDSLIYFIILTQEKLNNYSHNSQSPALILTFAGAWVETMYIGAYAENKPNYKIYETLGEEMGLLHNLIGGLEAINSENSEIDNLVKQLKLFEEKIPSISNDTKTQKLSQSEFDLLKIEIAAIRNNIVNN